MNPKSRARQDELTRRRRLNNGTCPTHGVGLAQVTHNDETGEELVECPRRDCEFRYWVPRGSATERALRS